jgi:hypothetical protein
MQESGELRQWHKITLDIEEPSAGEKPSAGETASTFRVSAAHGDAADGNATSGDVWRVHFDPPKTGEWTSNKTWQASNKGGHDLRGKRVLQHDGDQDPNFAGDGSVFLKSGVGSPENLLACSAFDATPGLHSHAAHAGAYRSGDPTCDAARARASSAI